MYIQQQPWIDVSIVIFVIENVAQKFVQDADIKTRSDEEVS